MYEVINMAGESLDLHIDSFEEAVEWAKEKDADVFKNGECVWANPEVKA